MSPNLVLLTMINRQVLEEGQKLVAASNREQQQDIRVQMKLLSERYCMSVYILLFLISDDVFYLK